MNELNIRRLFFLDFLFNSVAFVNMPIETFGNTKRDR